LKVSQTVVIIIASHTANQLLYFIFPLGEYFSLTDNVFVTCFVFASFKTLVY